MPLGYQCRRSIEVAVFVGLLTFMGIGKASIIPTLTSGPVADGSNWDFNYTASLQQDERLDPLSTNGATCPSTGAPIQCSPVGTFFTLYDVGSPSTFISASSPTGWGSTEQVSGITPSTINATFDSGTLLNVTFFYTGPIVTTGSVLPITGFQIVTTIDGVNAEGWYSGQATKDVGTDAGLTDQFDGRVPVPLAPTGPLGGVPEPATFLMLGSGLLAAALVWRRKVRA